jgi:Mrp family chromosome partitioning ATPase
LSGARYSVEGVLDALAMQPRRREGAGRAVMFVSARRSEGVTTAACAVALAAGPGAVYAIDLDLKRNALARLLSAEGQLGPKIDGKLNGVPFYSVLNAQERTPAFSYHRVGRLRVYAGVFDARVLPHNARVAVSSGPDYWEAARAGGAIAVIDAPALERSSIALRVARHLDGVVLVVGAAEGAAPAAIAAKASLEQAGANVIGLVYSGADAPTMAIERMLRQAG